MLLSFIIFFELPKLDYITAPYTYVDTVAQFPVRVGFLHGWARAATPAMFARIQKKIVMTDIQHIIYEK